MGLIVVSHCINNIIQAFTEKIKFIFKWCPVTKSNRRPDDY